MDYILNVDGLAFRASSKIHLKSFLTKGIYKISSALFLNLFKIYDLLTLNYQYGFKMYYMEDEIGYLWTKSLDLSYDDRLNIAIKIHNHVFYVYDLNTIIHNIVEALNLRDLTIKRLDISYDTDFDALTTFKTLYEDEASTKFSNDNKIIVNGTGKRNRQITIGSLSSQSKCVAIYNKTMELRKSKKEYIKEIHKKAFGDNTIYRVEVRLMSKLFDSWNIDIMDLASNAYLEQLFLNFFGTMVKFSRVDTNENIEFIPLNNNGLVIPRAKRPKKQSGGIKQVKAFINFLDREIDTKEFYGLKTGWYLIRSMLIKKYQLGIWYTTKK